MHFILGFRGAATAATARWRGRARWGRGVRAVFSLLLLLFFLLFVLLALFFVFLFFLGFFSRGFVKDRSRRGYLLNSLFLFLLGLLHFALHFCDLFSNIKLTRMLVRAFTNIKITFLSKSIFHLVRNIKFGICSSSSWLLRWSFRVIISCLIK